ncbi:MAG: RDD family protein [Alphaproteobacteria bacterium]|nr:RDD family protein [Alphaproteobacteria bacterium]
MADSLTGISFRYAGFWLRMVAGAFDTGIVLIAMWLLAWVFNVNYAALEPTEAELNRIGLLEAGAIFVGWIYYASMESTAPQATVGKLFLGIYVTDLAGERLSFGRASLRYWAKVISTVILFVGFLMAAFTRHKQALHDIVASSLVLKR